MTENVVHEVQDDDSSHCFLLSNHRNPGKPMNMVNIQGSSLGWGIIQLIKLGFPDWLWSESGPDAGSLLGVRAGGAEKRLISQERTMSLFYGTWKELHHLNAVGLWELGLGAHVWAQGYDSEALCLCVFPQEMFPSYTAQVTCELSKHFSSPLHNVYTLHDSLLSSTIPHVWLIFIFLTWRRWWGQWPKLLTLLCWKAKLRTFGCSQCDCSGPWPSLITQRWNPCHGARGPCICVFAWRY